ncbi:hypothetical protein [Prevotella ihumii]|uniref:hypothetical protein n=1 Tax=Prevotella ihumii TaxID=1917878 RepID=UPI00117C49B5|nr:hypothetical protein [Prevotella ihumii]
MLRFFQFNPSRTSDPSDQSDLSDKSDPSDSANARFGFQHRLRLFTMFSSPIFIQTVLQMYVINTKAPTI